MGVLIADSGATKTKWCLSKDEGNTVITTEGLNPYYHTTESIRNVLQFSLKKELRNEEITQLFFYGAGCDSDERKKILNDALASVFPGTDVFVFHDLLGAARATFFDQPGIACILGTGSNSCLYDGEKIIEHIPSLAFILGDEGSAGYFGKKLINNYFRFKLPEDLRKALEADYEMNMEHIMKGLYEKPQKSRFIASYAAFLGDHSDHPFIVEMLREGFQNFIDRVVMNYTGAKDHEVRFIGSVAYSHRDLIKAIMKERDLKPGLFVRNPMDRLEAYHKRKGGSLAG